MVQTNGPHDMYESLEFRKILLAYFDHFVKGADNGFDKRPHMQVWFETSSSVSGRLQDEAAKARFTAESPRYPIPVRPVSLALSQGGALIPAEHGEGQGDSYAYPVPGATVDADYFTDNWGALPSGWRRGSLVYTSAPLDRTLVAYGAASADLWLAATASDVDLQVTLTEIRPDGQEMLVQRGFLRMSDRVQDDSRSTELRPYPIDRPETMVALTPGVPALGRVEVTKFAHVFRKGSRLRLWIDTPSQYGGNGFAPGSEPSTNTVLHDAQHPSRLIFGVLDGVKAPADRPACGTILKQPCRPDPLAIASDR
jgi:predicted acyl esterase